MNRQRATSPQRGKPYRANSADQNLVIWIACGIGASVLVCLAIGVAFSVLMAQQVINTTTQLLEQNSETETDIAALANRKDGLEHLQERLTEIPKLPLFPHQEAQSLVAAIAEESTLIEQEMTAQTQFNQAIEQANLAAQKVQNPPHPTGVWQEAAQAWQKAVGHLESVPPDTSVYASSQERLAAYRSNFEQISLRLQNEANAEKQYRAAQAHTREIVAALRVFDLNGELSLRNSNDELADIQTKITQAIQAYAAIQSGTFYYQEAQETIAVYRSDYSLISRYISGGCTTTSCRIAGAEKSLFNRAFRF